MKMHLTFHRCEIDTDVSMPVDPPGEFVAEANVRIYLNYTHVIRKMENGVEVWHCFPLTPREQRTLDRKLYKSGPAFAENKRKKRKPRYTKQRRGVAP